MKETFRLKNELMKVNLVLPPASSRNRDGYESGRASNDEDSQGFDCRSGSNAGSLLPVRVLCPDCMLISAALTLIQPFSFRRLQSSSER